jgi:hypothetical protein
VSSQLPCVGVSVKVRLQRRRSHPAEAHQRAEDEKLACRPTFCYYYSRRYYE